MEIRVPTEAEFRAILRQAFEDGGFDVTDIAEDPENPRADQLISDDLTGVLLELKIKGEDEREERTREEALDAGQVHRYSDRSGRRNRMSGLIANGVTQLVSTPTLSDFKVLWLHGAGRYGDHHRNRFIDTLYGRRRLIDAAGGAAKDCFYFDNSDFFRHCNTLSAAVVSCGEEAQLCINDLHPAATKFRRSRFREFFRDAYIDPPELEARGDAYIAAASMERGDTAEMLLAVARKYGVSRFIDFDPTMHVAEARIGDWTEPRP